MITVFAIIEVLELSGNNIYTNVDSIQSKKESVNNRIIIHHGLGGRNLVLVRHIKSITKDVETMHQRFAILFQFTLY